MGTTDPENVVATILVVDDDPTLRCMIARFLARTGLRIEVAATGCDALAVVAESGPTLRLILTDIDMPGMSGLELAAIATRRCPTCKVLLMSGLPAPPEVQARGWNYLAKPFRLELLLQVVQSALNIHLPQAKPIHPVRIQ